MRPRIVVTISRRPLGPPGTNPARARPGRPELVLGRAYLEAVARGGGLPILLAPQEGLEDELAAWAAEHADGVLISGATADIAPAFYGEAERVPVPERDDARARTELALARLCAERGIPVLGVCGGMQALVVAAGGSLIQDIATELPGALEHEQPTPPREPWHPVTLDGGRARAALGPTAQVNSTHHQAVLRPGPYRVTGWAPDGVVEAVELPGHPFCVGVQWHPEALDGALYPELCQAAAAFRASRP